MAKAWLSFGVCASEAENGDGWALLKALLTQPEANLYGETCMYRPLFEQQLERSAVPENEAQTGTTERQRDMFAALVGELRLAEFITDPVKDIVGEEGSALLSGDPQPGGGRCADKRAHGPAPLRAQLNALRRRAPCRPHRPAQGPAPPRPRRRIPISREYSCPAPAGRQQSSGTSIADMESGP